MRPKMSPVVGRETMVAAAALAAVTNICGMSPQGDTVMGTQAQTTVKLAAHVVESTRQRENIADSFNYAVNAAACGNCGKPVAWVSAGTKGNARAGDWLHAEAVKHCPACTPDAKTGAFRVRTTLPDGDAIALAVNDRLTFTPKADTAASVDAVKLALDSLMQSLKDGSLTPIQYAEAVAALSA